MLSLNLTRACEAARGKPQKDLGPGCAVHMTAREWMFPAVPHQCRKHQRNVKEEK